MEDQDLIQRSDGTWNGDRACIDDDDTASDTEGLYITMIDQVCRSLYCSSHRCAN